MNVSQVSVVHGDRRKPEISVKVSLNDDSVLGVIVVFSRVVDSSAKSIGVKVGVVGRFRRGLTQFGDGVNDGRVLLDADRMETVDSIPIFAHLVRGQVF